MPTIFAHAAIGWTLVKLDRRFADDRRVAWCAMALAMLPDADGPLAGLTGAHTLLAHRGVTHSLAFAAVAGVAAAAAFGRASGGVWASIRRRGPLLVLVTASHGIFDAFTDGGSGIAFFAPFSTARYHAPWTPIPVAMMSAEDLFTSWGANLLVWEWALFGFFALAVWIWRERHRWSTPSTMFLLAGLVAWAAGASSGLSDRLVRVVSGGCGIGGSMSD